MRIGFAGSPSFRVAAMVYYAFVNNKNTMLFYYFIGSALVLRHLWR